MSNSEYIGKWKFMNDSNILEIFECNGSKLHWKWIKLRGETIIHSKHYPGMGGECLGWRPYKEEGYTRVYGFRHYLKKL